LYPLVDAFRNREVEIGITLNELKSMEFLGFNYVLYMYSLKDDVRTIIYILRLIYKYESFRWSL